MSLSSFSAEDKAKAGLIQPKVVNSKPYAVEPWTPRIRKWENLNHKLIQFRGKELEKLYWGIAEVAQMLKVTQSKIRFWMDELDITVKRARKGDRMFTYSDVEQMKLIAKAAEDLHMESIRRIMKEGRLAEVVRALEKKD